MKLWMSHNNRNSTFDIAYQLILYIREKTQILLLQALNKLLSITCNNDLFISWNENNLYL